MALLLTPYFQTELGLVFYRIPPTVSVSDFGERTVLQPAPETLRTVKSGKIANFEHNPTACKQLKAFAKSLKVRASVNKNAFGTYGDLPYVKFVKSIKTCQCRDGEYCHPEKTLAEVESGSALVCWHHDKLWIEGKIDASTISALAEQNWCDFIAMCIRNDLRKSQYASIEFADLVFWATLKGLLGELNQDELRQFLGLPVQVDLGKESTIGFEVASPMSTLQNSIKPLLALKVDPEPLSSFLARPKLKRFECRKWLQFVKSQPCVCCGKRADDPHHIIGYNGKMGGKEHDLFTIPLCRSHHNELHASVERFEQQYGSQITLLYKFLDRAIGMGALVIDG